jgi:hypothetical protein
MPVQDAAIEQSNESPGLGMPRWLDLGSELRGRVESYTGTGLTDKDNSYYLSRARLDVGIRAHEQVRFSFQFQDARAPGWDNAPAPASQTGSADLRLANVQIGDAQDGAVQLIVGRQAMYMGSKRLISTSNWSNVCPAFDGVGLSHHWGRLRVHHFAATRVNSVKDGFDRVTSGTKTFGTHASMQWNEGRTLIEPYWLANTFAGRVSELGDRGALKVQSFGSRLLRKGPAGLDYEVEIMGQKGEIAGAALSAWGAHGNVGRRIAAWRWTPRFFADYSFASGDGDRSDGKHNTLQQLFPTHKWGTADNLAWRNIHEPLVGVQLEPHPKWSVTAQFRELWLANRQDGLYSVSGNEMVRNPAATSSHIGQELDFHVKHRLSSRLELIGGFGHLFKGAYLKQSMPSHGVNVAFLGWTYKR